MAENEIKTETKPVGRPNIYVQSLTFNDGTTLPVNKNDIVVFVGPNNVGKSQALKDVECLAKTATPGIIVPTVAFSGFSQNGTIDGISLWLEKTIPHWEGFRGQHVYAGLDFMISTDVACQPFMKNGPWELAKVFVCSIKTDSRLSVSTPPEIMDIVKQPKHPIHVLQQNAGIRNKVSKYFKLAFDVPLVLFTQFGKHLPLVLGPKPKLLDEYSDEIEREEKVAGILRSYPHLERQGDGMRSFAGIMLYLSIDHYNTFLIDEPELFLHPPQARLMGEIVGDLLSNEQQAFISTHSIHFIQGLLEKCPERVKVVRITRTGNTNAFSILDKSRLLELSKDPFMKYSNVLEGLFYKNVVLCEADADCMFYSMLNGASDMKGAKSADTLFVHCGGKQRMAAVVRDLCALHVDFRVVPDFDIFNDKNTLKNLVEACGGTWSECERDFNVLSADILNRSRNDKPENVLLTEIQNLLNANSFKPVSNSKIESIKSLLERESEWGRLKKSGLHGIPSGEPQNACTALLRQLKTIGIHVVPCGELERFVPDCGGHGPSWIQNVLDTHPELSDPIFAEAKAFVKSWNL